MAAQLPATLIRVAASLSAQAVVGIRTDCVLPPPSGVLTALMLDHYFRSMVVVVTQEEPLASRQFHAQMEPTRTNRTGLSRRRSPDLGADLSDAHAVPADDRPAHRISARGSRAREQTAGRAVFPARCPELPHRAGE